MTVEHKQMVHGPVKHKVTNTSVETTVVVLPPDEDDDDDRRVFATNLEVKNEPDTVTTHCYRFLAYIHFAD